jgi:hypothetical protein
LGKKFYNSFKTGPNFFVQHLKNKIIFNFVKFVATKKGLTKNFFHPSLLLLFLDPGSGMGKNQDPGLGINIPEPQHWYNIQSLCTRRPASWANSRAGSPASEYVSLQPPL